MGNMKFTISYHELAAGYGNHCLGIVNMKVELHQRLATTVTDRST